MKTLLVALALCFSIQTKAQINIIKFDCSDSVKLITNEALSVGCEFYFQNENPNVFYVENFTRDDYYQVVYRNNHRPLKGKLLTSGYKAKPYDFIYTYSKKKNLLFYYILKTRQEQDLLMLPFKDHATLNAKLD